jgi:AraC family transcriptional regulator
MSGGGITEIIINIGGYIMNPVVREMPAFKVAGYGIKTDITNGYMKDIAAYWETYTGEGLEGKMYSQLKPQKHGEVGLCVPSSGEGTLVYLLGVIVEDFSKVTSDMLTVEVPEAKYAIFTTPPVDLARAGTYQNNPLGDVVKSTWKYIFEEWFPKCGYTYDETRIDFEFYDERCHFRPDATMEIYVPIK